MPASAPSSRASASATSSASPPRHGISGVQHACRAPCWSTRPASRSSAAATRCRPSRSTNMPNAVMTGVTPDYIDSSDGVGDTFDASVYALSYLRDGRGHAGHHPQHGGRRRLRLDLGRRSVPPGLFARQRQSRPDQQPRRLHHRRRSADRPARHGRHRRRHQSMAAATSTTATSIPTSSSSISPISRSRRRRACTQNATMGDHARRRHRHHRFRLHRPQAVRHRHGAGRLRQRRHPGPGDDRARRRQPQPDRRHLQRRESRSGRRRRALHRAGQRHRQQPQRARHHLDRGDAGQ